jgi:hypothetical protein
MKSALGLVLGVCTLALVGCAGSEDNTGNGPIAVPGGGGTGGSGSGNTAGSSVVPGGTTGTSMAGTTTGGTATGGTGGDVTPPAGVPLTPMDGWVDGMSNTLMVQGAMFSYGDDTSKMGMTSDFMGDHACIKGVAAKVDLKCTPVAPATDCYGTFWGAAIGLNMNQAIDPMTMMGGMAMPYDASAIKGFGFVIDGAMIPAPKDFRFKIEGPNGEFCTPKTKPLKAGANTFMFEDLVSMCWMPPANAATAATTKSMVLKIAWQVVTNSTTTVPFDFCVKNVVAIQ